MPARTRETVQQLTTTEAAVLALLAIEGERSGYDLLKLVSKAIAYVWAPARSQLYTVLPRLARDGLAEQRRVVQTTRPDKVLYRFSTAGSRPPSRAPPTRSTCASSSGASRRSRSSSATSSSSAGTPRSGSRSCA